MELVEWKRISGDWGGLVPRVASPDRADLDDDQTTIEDVVSDRTLTVYLHHFVLETLTAKHPICVRLMMIGTEDKVKVYLGHKCHTPFVIPNIVDTFMDIWIDPFEFSADKYNLDQLPNHLSVHIEWEAVNPHASVFVLIDPDSCWTVSLVEHGILEQQALPVHESKQLEIQGDRASILSRAIEESSQTFNQNPRTMALVSMLVCLMTIWIKNPSRVVKMSRSPANSTGSSEMNRRDAESNTETSSVPRTAPSSLVSRANELTSHDSQQESQGQPDETSRIVGLVLLHARRFWPSFKDSSLTSWLSTIVNATIVDYNDINGTEFPEDFDLIELVSAWYPNQPWSKTSRPMSDFIDTIQSLLQVHILQEAKRSDWQNSLWISALAMAQPHASICLPLQNTITYPYQWSMGTIVRNYIYGLVYVTLGANTTEWLRSFSITPDNLKEMTEWMTNVIIFFTEDNFEIIVKRIIMLVIQLGNSIK